MPEVLGRRRADSAFTLNRLDHHAGGALAEGGLQGGGITHRDVLHARHERLEIGPVFGLARQRQRPNRSPMEGVVQGDDFVLGRILSAAVSVQDLDCGFHRFRTRVAEESPVQAAGFGEFLGERPLELVVIQIRAVNQQGRLFPDHACDARVSVAEGVDANAGDQVKVPLARNVVQPRALAPLQRERITRIVLK